MVGKKVNLLALTLLNILIVSTVTSSTAAPAASNSNIGFNIPSDREMAMPVAVAYEQDPQQQETLRAEDEYINYLRELLRRRAALNALTIQAMEPIVSQKRSCYLNAGMTHNCDFKDLMSAVNARKFWESGSNPGKRRKRSLVDLMTR